MKTTAFSSSCRFQKNNGKLIKSKAPHPRGFFIAANKQRRLYWPFMLNKALAFYTKYFALWVVIFAVLAYYFPQPLEA
jgi:hypothetical protein